MHRLGPKTSCWLGLLSAAVVCGAATTPARAVTGGSTALLIAETGTDGVAHFWWGCEKRPRLPVTDRLSPMLARLGLRPISRCSDVDVPIHRSLQTPALKAWEATNLASVLGASRLVTGTVELTTGADLPRLGLAHVHGRARLRVQDLQSGQVVATVSLDTDGYDTDPGLAADKAVDIVSAQLLRQVHTWAPSADSAASRAPAGASLRLIASGRMGALDEALATVREAKGVETARWLTITQKDAEILVRPPEALLAVERALRDAGFSFERGE